LFAKELRRVCPARPQPTEGLGLARVHPSPSQIACMGEQGKREARGEEGSEKRKTREIQHM
jgi:hypothetical protein